MEFEAPGREPPPGDASPTASRKDDMPSAARQRPLGLRAESPGIEIIAPNVEVITLDSDSSSSSSDETSDSGSSSSVILVDERPHLPRNVPQQDALNDNAPALELPTIPIFAPTPTLNLNQNVIAQGASGDRQPAAVGSAMSMGLPGTSSFVPHRKRSYPGSSVGQSSSSNSDNDQRDTTTSPSAIRRRRTSAEDLEAFEANFSTVTGQQIHRLLHRQLQAEEERRQNELEMASNEATFGEDNDGDQSNENNDNAGTNWVQENDAMQRQEEGNFDINAFLAAEAAATVGPPLDEDDTECPICCNPITLRIIADCNCRKPICQRCFFQHATNFTTAQNGLLCAFCRQQIVTISYNIKSDFDFRTWQIVDSGAMPMLIQALSDIESGGGAGEEDQLEEEAEEVEVRTNRLRHVTFIMFVQAFRSWMQERRRLNQSVNGLELGNALAYFRGFVYLHDLKVNRGGDNDGTIPANAPLNADLLKFIKAEVAALSLTFNFTIHEAFHEELERLVKQYDGANDRFALGTPENTFARELHVLIERHWITPTECSSISFASKIWQEAIAYLRTNFGPRPRRKRARFLRDQKVFVSRAVYTNYQVDEE